MNIKKLIHTCINESKRGPVLRQTRSKRDEEFIKKEASALQKIMAKQEKEDPGQKNKCFCATENNRIFQKPHNRTKRENVKM